MTQLATLATPVTPPDAASWTYDAGFDTRWDAWRAKGRVEDAAFARKMKIVGPLVSVLALLAVIGFAR